MTEHTHEAVADAMRIAEEVSPAPARAAAALKILSDEVMHRWEQRTALSFRLQDLRAELVKAGIPDDSPLYLALHALTAAAEAWMHPDTLSEAFKATMARRDAAYMAEVETNSELRRKVRELQHLVAAAPAQVEFPARALQLIVTCPRIGDGRMFPLVAEALVAYGEQTLADGGTSWSLTLNSGSQDETQVAVSVIPDASDVSEAKSAEASNG